MSIGLKVLSGLLAVFMVYMGVAIVMDPVAAGSGLGVIATGQKGIHTIRGDLGGLFLLMGACALVGLLDGWRQWLLFPVLVVLTIAALRVTSFFLDGGADDWITPVILEVVMGAVWFATYKKA